MSKITVDILIRVVQDFPDKSGRGIILFHFEGNVKEIYVSSLEKTVYRSIILLCTEAIQDLKQPCIVNLYTQKNFGFKIISDHDKEWGNRDLGDKLIRAAKLGGHTLNLINCSEHLQGRLYQHNLLQKIEWFEKKVFELEGPLDFTKLSNYKYPAQIHTLPLST